MLVRHRGGSNYVSTHVNHAFAILYRYIIASDKLFRINGTNPSALLLYLASGKGTE